MPAILRAATRHRLALAAAALALLATLIVSPVLGTKGARALGPLPACRYDDILTMPLAYADWPVTLVDTILSVPVGYVPPDLVPTSQADIAGGGKVRAVMIDDLRALAKAAAAAGRRVAVESAYRSYAEQQEVFDSWVELYGYDDALMIPARPGHSEHQLGLAIDFRANPRGKPPAGPFSSTKAGKWMKAHAWEYGFVMSYPNGATALTCYEGEPWHFRYVGRELAARIRESGMTPREYLWTNFTTTVVPGPTASGPDRTPDPARTPQGPSTADPSPTAPPPTGEPPTTTPPRTDPAPPIEAATTAPEVTEPPEVTPVAWSQPALLAGMGGGLITASAVAWLALRRGRRVR